MELAAAKGHGVSKAIGKAGWAVIRNPMIIAPALGAVVSTFGLQPPEGIKTLLGLLAMMPTGAGPFMLAQVYGQRGAVASQTILATTVLSIVTISLFLTFIR